MQCLTADTVLRVSVRQYANFVPFGQVVAETWQFFDFFFQNGGHPPISICYTRV